MRQVLMGQVLFILQLLEFLQQVLDLIVLFLDVDQSQGLSEVLLLILFVKQETVKIQKTILPVPMVQLPLLLCLFNLF